MNLLVPVDTSDCSVRALRLGAEMARRYEADLHVVHVTDYRGDDTETLLERDADVLREEGLEDDPEVRTNVRLSEPRPSNRVGDELLELVAEEGYDHVVMGHHGAGAVERLVLGSAAETVVRAAAVPATIVP
ncbi:MAG: universal stress protein [Salinigranum sp.]